MDKLNQSILVNKVHTKELEGIGHNKQEAIANAFEKIRQISYELSKNMLVQMKITDVILLDYKVEKPSFSQLKKNKEKIKIKLKITFDYSHIKF